MKRIVGGLVVVAILFVPVGGEAAYVGATHTWHAGIAVNSTAGYATFSTDATASMYSANTIGLPNLYTPARACARYDRPQTVKKTRTSTTYTQRYELACPTGNPTTTLHATGVVHVTGAVPSVVKDRKWVCARSGCKFSERTVAASSVVVDLTWIPTGVGTPSPSVGIAPLSPWVSVAAPLRWEATVTGSLNFRGVARTLDIPAGQRSTVTENVYASSSGLL